MVLNLSFLGKKLGLKKLKLICTPAPLHPQNFKKCSAPNFCFLDHISHVIYFNPALWVNIEKTHYLSFSKISCGPGPDLSSERKDEAIPSYTFP